MQIPACDSPSPAVCGPQAGAKTPPLVLAAGLDCLGARQSLARPN